jgi:hypothetical protein
MKDRKIVARKKHRRYRSARSGRFVAKKTAEKDPDTTVSETVEEKPSE